MAKKEFLFISDFDGTISLKDYYMIMVERYHTAKFERSIAEMVYSGKITSFDYLNEICGYSVSEDEFNDNINSIILDESLCDVVSMVENAGGKFIVLSAGCRYYIHKRLEDVGLGHIEIYANKGTKKNGAIIMQREFDNPFYDKKFGVNKEKVVQYFRSFYDKIYFAGDGSPDYNAGILADVRFAKNNLIDLYKKSKTKHHPINSFKDILRILPDYLSNKETISINNDKE